MNRPYTKAQSILARYCRASYAASKRGDMHPKAMRKRRKALANELTGCVADSKIRSRIITSFMKWSRNPTTMNTNVVLDAMLTLEAYAHTHSEPAFRPLRTVVDDDVASAFAELGFETVEDVEQLDAARLLSTTEHPGITTQVLAGVLNA